MLTRGRLCWLACLALTAAACGSTASRSSPMDASTPEDRSAPGADAGDARGDGSADGGMDATLTDSTVAADASDAPSGDTTIPFDSGGPDATPNDSMVDTGSPSTDGPSDDGIADAPSESTTPRDSATPPDASAPTTCTDGSPILYTRTSCPGTPPVPASPLVTAAQSATRGDVLSLGGLDEPAAPCIPLLVCTKTGAPTMLFSDDPESPSSDGILYADVIGPGAFRVYVYHTNGGSGSRKFTVVALNQGTTDVHATVGPKGIAGPGTDYVAIGKSAIQAWLSDTTTSTVVVPAGQRVVFDADLDAVAAQNGQLAHAIIDFTLDGPVKMSVVSVLSSENAATVTAGLPLLPNDQLHQRGTFPGATRVLQAQGPIDGAGVRHVTLGDGTADLDLTGQDAVDGTQVSLSGNYGLVYDLVLPVASDMAFVLAPQGGAWGGAATLPSGLDGPAGISLLPSASSSLGSQSSAIFLGSFASQSSVSATLLSAGGSSLPVDLASVPVP